MKGRALSQGVEVERGVRSFPDRVSATCGSFVRGSLLRLLGPRARVVGEAPFQVEGFGSEPGRRGDLTEGRSFTLAGFGPRARDDRSVAREETLGRLSTLRRSSGQALFGEGRRMSLGRGSFLRLGKPSLGLEAGGNAHPRVFSPEYLHPTLERGKERGFRAESGKAGQGLRGDSKRLPKPKGWRSCLEGVAVLRPGCLVLGEGPKWLTV